MKFLKRLFQRRKPRDLQLLIHIRYREGKERYERVTLAPHFLDDLRKTLVMSENIREVAVYEGPIFRHHKSYAEDFSEEALMKGVTAFDKMMGSAKTMEDFPE